MHRWIPLLLLLACGGRGDGRKPPKGDGPKKGADKELHKRPEDIPVSVTRQTISAPPTVVLVVMDTVRGDHTSLCGYARPTTPNLEALAQSGMTHTCAAYTAGTWTIPTHASLFTGLHPTEHNLLNKGIPLDPDTDTLAEICEAHGYQTVMISANPTLTRASGLWQGFSIVHVPKGTTDDFRFERFDNKLEKTLKGLDPAKPLFLVVNIFDAHDPYPDIPAGVGWVPKRPGIQINPLKEDETGPARRFVAGQMPDGESKKYIQHITDTYDYGIFRADRNVSKTAQILKEGGWLERGHRILITSDHGEHLGDHSLVRHDGPPWESVTRVFALYQDTTAAAPLTFPEPFSNTMTFWLLKDGALPDPLLPASSASIAYEDAGPDHARRDSVAYWPDSRRKLMWSEGPMLEIDLEQDPDETRPKDLAPDDPLLPGMEQRKADLLRSKDIAMKRGKDPEIMKSLEAIGYVN